MDNLLTFPKTRQCGHSGDRPKVFGNLNSNGGCLMMSIRIMSIERSKIVATELRVSLGGLLLGPYLESIFKRTLTSAIRVPKTRTPS
jgi:hypothetical protein